MTQASPSNDRRLAPSWTFYHERMAEFLSEPEAMVMEVVRQHVPRVREDAAAWVLREFSHFDVPYTEAEIDDAVDSLIAKGIIRVVSARDVRRPRPKYSTYEAYFSSSVGLLDWTRAGNSFAKRVYPSRHVRPGH